jgi:Ca2+-transporting ATPase
MQRPPRKPGTKIVTRPWIIRWFIFGFVVAATALSVLEWGPGKPSTTHASVNMTMAFAVVSLSAVNIGLVMRRERQAPWSSPVFPYLGWIILGWILTWAAVELNMLQRLLDTTSLSGRECPRGCRRRQDPPAAAPEPGRNIYDNLIETPRAIAATSPGTGNT